MATDFECRITDFAGVATDFARGDAKRRRNGNAVGDGRVLHRHGTEYGLLLKPREHLRKHAPSGQRVGAVLDPAALVPKRIGHGGGERQGKAAGERVRGQAVVGAAEVPDVVGDDEDCSSSLPAVTMV